MAKRTSSWNYVRCRTCGHRSTTIEGHKSHIAKKHPKLKSGAIYKTYTYNYKAKPKSKPKRVGAHNITADLNEIVIPVFIRIPLVVGKPVVIDTQEVRK